MDTLELLARLGQVEPADPEVLDAALRTLADAVGLDAPAALPAHAARPAPRPIWRRPVRGTPSPSEAEPAGPGRGPWPRPGRPAPRPPSRPS
jgi:hypothetical protein